MPTIKLSRYECSRDLLPSVCVFCGAPAVTRRKRRFSWFPGWIWLIILLSWLIGLILALVLTKSMTVRLPVCADHEGFWRRNKQFINIGSVAVFLVCAGLFAVVIVQKGEQANELAGWLCGGGAAFFFLWLIAVVVVLNKGVRAAEITDRSITLSKVHETFRTALLADRDRDRKADEEDEQELRELLRERREAREAARREGHEKVTRQPTYDESEQRAGELIDRAEPAREEDFGDWPPKSPAP